MPKLDHDECVHHHIWGFTGFGGGWSCTLCDRCGRGAIGNSLWRWDLLARLWPKRFGCRPRVKDEQESPPKGEIPIKNSRWG